jgi:transposase
LVAARFEVARCALQRWVKRHRETGSVEPMPRGGGNVSPVDLTLLEKVVSESGDATSHELTAAYNRRVARVDRVHRSSIQRALRRAGYVFKKKSFIRPSSSAPMSKKSERDLSAD